MIKLRLFRAIDEPETCMKFVRGHTHVLENIGVTKIASSTEEWMYNPGVYVIIVENEKKEVFGGARVHVASKNYRLPIEYATSYLDPNVITTIDKYAETGTGEICGLWNSREISGMGIGAIFLTRASVAISTQIGLTSLFALCAPYTVKIAAGVGYEVDTIIGNNGTFYYPKLDLLATFMILKDVATLSHASIDEYDAILKIRNNPVIDIIENYRGREVQLSYDLKLKH